MSWNPPRPRSRCRAAVRYIKDTQSHPQAAGVEAAGLRWLKSAEPAGGPQVVGVLDSSAGSLHLERVTTQRASASAAAEFGAALAKMHQSVWPGGPLNLHRDSQISFGALPPNHPAGVPHLFGPADQLLELGAGQHQSWGTFHAAERLEPVFQQLEATLTPAENSCSTAHKNASPPETSIPRSQLPSYTVTCGAAMCSGAITGLCSLTQRPTPGIESLT